LIFAGTDKRRDVFQATVSLVFSDCPEDWGLVDNKLRVTRQINDRTGTDLLTGQNGRLDAQTVAQLLEGAGLDPQKLVFDHNTFSPLPCDCPLNILDLRKLAESSVTEEHLERYRHDRQLIVLTDDKRIMPLCDNISGITMEE
jgi:chromosome segregation ATPase